MTKAMTMTMTKTMTTTLLKNTTIQDSERPVTFETFDQSDQETRPVQQKDNVKDIETLISFLTIENNNLNIHSDP